MEEALDMSFDRLLMMMISKEQCIFTAVFVLRQTAAQIMIL